MAWWVVLGHASQMAGSRTYLPGPLVGLIESGRIAVDVFIIVSGFVITHLLLSKRENYGAYITRRFFRIAPIYLFCIALAILVVDLYHLAYLTPWASDPAMRVARVAAEAENFWAYLLTHLTLLHGLIPHEVLPYSGSAILAPAWSLSLEWQFYLIAPLLVSMVAARAPVMLATVAACLLALIVFRSGHLGHWQYLEFLPLAIQYFLIGIISRLALNEPKRAEFYLVLGVLVLFAGAAEIAIWTVFMALALSEKGLIRLPTPIDRLAGIFVTNRYVAMIGSWSYSTYLIHIPIFAIMLGGYAAISGNLTQPAAAILVILSLPLVLIVSWLTYRLIEKPFMKFGRDIAERRRAAEAT